MPDDAPLKKAAVARGKRLRPFAMLLAGAGVVLLACPARADDARSVAFVSEGPDAEAIATRVAARMPTGYAATDAHAFRAALSHGARAPLAGALKSRHADADLVARARKAAGDAHVAIAVLLHVRKSKKAEVVHVWVFDAGPSDGLLVDQDVSLHGATSPADAADATWSAITSAFPAESPSPAPAPPSPPPAPAPAPASPAADARGNDVAEADVAPRPVDGTTPPSLVQLGVAFEGGSRHFAYTDRLTPTLRPYDLVMTPVVAVRAAFEPFARSGQAALQDLGLAGEYSRAIALSSDDTGGASVRTSWQTFRVDLRDRIRFGHAASAGVHAGFGGNDFKFDGALAGPAQLPSVAYRFVRAGLDGQGAIGDFRLYGSASYLVVLSTGAVGDLFPRQGVGGIDASVGVARSFARNLDVSLEAGYTRFFYSMKPEPGDPYVAGGALDEMASLSLGVTYGF